MRGNRNLALTAAGALLKRRVEEMLALEERIKQEIAQGDDVGGTVSIGLAESASTDIAADRIGLFRNKYPEVKFNLVTAMADEVLRRNACERRGRRAFRRGGHEYDI